jgi:sorbitol-6-phosphate 2-dehydrogenase
MNHVTIAALIRGLCIDLCGKPQFVVYDAAGKGLSPTGAMVVEITSSESVENAALVIRKVYEDWKKSAVANSSGDSVVLLPSCVALCVNGKPEALYWIDGDYDSARRRLLEKDAYTRIETPTKQGSLIKAEERAAIVKNRVALVTGGAQGIGEEIVRNIAAAGAFVFIADLNIEGANKLAVEINAEEGRTAALSVEVNVCDEASVEKMFNYVAETTGGLDLCVSNAGVLKAGSVLEQELPDFKFVTDINYTGFFVISKFCGRLMRTQHLTAPSWKTDIVQVNSKSGLEGSNKNGAYAGGKFGGLGLVASFALELVEYNIKVNALCPGNFLDGPLWSHPENGLFVQYLKTGKVPGAKTVADVRSFYESKVPMKRGCTGKDLVRALYYVIEQEYETGQAIPVTGGQVMLH